MNATDYIDTLAASGRAHFTNFEAAEAIGGSSAAVRAQLRRLQETRHIARPARGFYVIVPPEYRSLRCLPAEQFIDQLMSYLGQPYYLALLSAAERHGAAHQRPQRSQVMVPRNRRPLTCGLVGFEFIARHDLERMPVSIANTPRGTIRVSTPEVTALELVGYPDHAGGVDNVASVVAELSEELRAELLIDVATRCPISWSQRLGYLLELSGNSRVADDLSHHVRANARGWIRLRRAADLSGATWEARWKLIVNTQVDSET